MNTTLDSSRVNVLPYFSCYIVSMKYGIITCTHLFLSGSR